jgi:hypothetical protein
MHWLCRALNSISAMLSQLPCLGGNYERHKPSIFVLAAGQAPAGKVSQNSGCQWIEDFRLTPPENPDPRTRRLKVISRPPKRRTPQPWGTGPALGFQHQELLECRQGASGRRNPGVTVQRAGLLREGPAGRNAAQTARPGDRTGSRRGSVVGPCFSGGMMRIHLEKIRPDCQRSGWEFTFSRCVGLR